VIISEVVPPFDKSLPLIREYLAEIKKLDPEKKPSFVSLEGYIAGKILIKALKIIKGEITRESIVKAMASLGTFDIGLGVPLRLDETHHQASSYVWAVRIEKGKVVPFDFKELKKMRGTGCNL
jgi:ABC-type branched-subunit amino acid transport system substrate-binding protein